MTTSECPDATNRKQRPLLGVIACNRTVGGEIAASVMHRYLAAAARHADASLVIIPSMPDLIDTPRIAAAVDGVLLTGSPSNIEPSRYRARSGEGPFDVARDETSLRLIETMSKVGKPILGICRGMQEINVALGGSLRSDVGLGTAPHHADADADLEGMFGHRHPVRLTEGGVLAQALGTDHIEVNSVHYQAIDHLAPGLFLEARADDGVIEAVSSDLGGAPLLAVQWHPEWRPDENGAGQAIFTLFGRMLRGAPLHAQA